MTSELIYKIWIKTLSEALTGHSITPQPSSSSRVIKENTQTVIKEEKRVSTAIKGNNDLEPLIERDLLIPAEVANKLLMQSKMLTLNFKNKLPEITYWFKLRKKSFNEKEIETCVSRREFGALSLPNKEFFLKTLKEWGNSNFSTIRTLNKEEYTLFHLPKKKNVLGAGSHGQVKLAFSHTHKRIDAAKIITIAQWTFEGIIRLLQEINFLESIAHLRGLLVRRTTSSKKNSFGVSSEYKVYLIQERHPGKNLTSYLNDLKKADKLVILPSILKLFFLSMCELKRYHDAQLIHRDIKLENIVYHQEDDSQLQSIISTRLVDYTYSIRMTPEQATSGKVLTTGCPGSAFYIAPEVIEVTFSASPDMGVVEIVETKISSESEKSGFPYSKASDVYAGGALLSLLLAQTKIIQIERKNNVSVKMTEINPAVEKKYGTPLLSEFIDFIQQLLAPLPENRPTVDTAIEKIKVLCQKLGIHLSREIAAAASVPPLYYNDAPLYLYKSLFKTALEEQAPDLLRDPSVAELFTPPKNGPS